MYYRILLQFISWWAVAFSVASAIIAACVLLDWFGHFGWGYPRYSLPILGFAMILGILIHKAALSALE
jgi:hypothetical protein